MVTFYRVWPPWTARTAAHRLPIEGTSVFVRHALGLHSTASVTSVKVRPHFTDDDIDHPIFLFSKTIVLVYLTHCFFFLPKACLEEAAAVRNLLFIWFLTRNLACLWVVILGLPDRGRCLTVCERRKRCWSLKLVVLLELILSEIGKLDSKEQRAKYRPFSL